MTILFVVTTLDFGGAEEQVKSLAVNMKSKGHDIAVISLKEPKAHIEQLQDSGITCYTLKMSSPRHIVSSILKTRVIVDKIKPDIIHSHMVHANIFMRIANIFTNTSELICTAHNIYEGSKYRDIWYRWTDDLCKLTTNVSREAVNEYAKRRLSKSHKLLYIPNGISLEKYKYSEVIKRADLNISEKDEVWLNVARFAQEKNHLNLIEAFSQYLTYNAQSILLLVGDGELRYKAEEMVRRKDLNKRVLFLGKRTDVQSLMKMCNYFILPSCYEGLPMVLLEAGASSLPCIGTDIPGIRELLDDDCGVLSKSTDVDDILHSMVKMSSKSKDELESMVKKYYNRIDANYNMNIITEKWLALYTSLLNN